MLDLSKKKWIFKSNKMIRVLFVLLILCCSGLNAKYNIVALYQHATDQLLPNSVIQEGVVGCGTKPFAVIGANFGDCVLNNLGLQPNCSIYEDCLLKSNGDFNTYESCLVQTPMEQVYAYLNATGSTEEFYYVYIYIDSACTIPVPSDQNPAETYHVQVPFGCFFNQLNSTQGICPIVTSRTSAATTLSFFWDALF